MMNRENKEKRMGKDAAQGAVRRPRHGSGAARAFSFLLRRSAARTTVLAALLITTALFTPSCGQSTSEVPVATAQKRPLRIVLNQEGTLQPYNFVRIKADISSVQQLTVTFLVPNGTSVSAGEKLLEFDPMEVDDAISKAQLEVRSANTSVVNMQEEKKKSELDRELNLREAEFKKDVAEKNLSKYVEVEYQKELDGLEIAIKKAEVNLEEAHKNLEAAQRLLDKGLVPKFEVQKNEIALEEATFLLGKTKSDLDLFKKHTDPLRRRELQNEVDTSSRLLESRKSYFGAVLSQRESDLANADYRHEEAKKDLEKLKKDKGNLLVKAPVEGIVNYGEPQTGNFRWGGDETELKVGEKVRAQQTLMYIPDLKEMFVELQIDEIDISKLLASDKPKEEKAEEGEAEPDIDLNSLTEEQLMGVFMKAGKEAQELFASLDTSKIDEQGGGRRGGKMTDMFALLSEADQKKVKKFLAKHLGQKPSTRFKPLPVKIVAEGFPDAVINGVIDYVAGAAQSGSWWEETTKFQVKVKLENSFDWFRPGMKMKAEVVVEETKPVVCIPVDAVFSKDDKRVCYVKNGSSFEAVEIETGKTDRSFIEVTKGISAGTVVALTEPAQQK
ncbi:MAG: hypothetical protein RDV41_01440 [Planctomycetota bacterium]|nr:hypothetical protein [Planctomycetota bacterium]